MSELIIFEKIGKSELHDLMKAAVREIMMEINPPTPEPPIKGIHELAKFIRVSPARAQKMKNDGLFPYWQDGRTLLFDPAEVRKAMQGGNK
jgi:hypothetical protein